MQRRAREFETLFRLTPIGIGVANDPECRDISVNPAFAEMLRIEHGANASLSAPPSGTAAVRHRAQRRAGRRGDLPLQMAARLGAEVKNVELDVIHPDGTSLTLYEYAAPLFDDQGKVRGAVGAFLDISELKRAEDRLRRLVAGERAALSPGAGGQPPEGRVPGHAVARAADAAQRAARAGFSCSKSGQLTEEKRRACARGHRAQRAQLQAQLTSDLLDISGVITGKLRLQTGAHAPAAAGRGRDGRDSAGRRVEGRGMPRCGGRAARR